MPAVRCTISDLAADLATAMDGWPEPDNGQVRALPDERTLRWYGTIGLMDRPLSWRGRTALYGERHLLQILAVKRLQSAGWRIATILERLLGADDEALRRVAHAVASEVPPATAVPDEAPRRQEIAIWSAPVRTPTRKHAPRLHITLDRDAELVLPEGLVDLNGLDQAIAPLQAWLASHSRTTTEQHPKDLP